MKTKSIYLFFNLLLSCIAMVILNSCIPGEDAVTPYTHGNTETYTVAMGQNYERQVYFTFADSGQSCSNSYTDWDLSLKNSADRKLIVKINFAAQANVAVFNMPYSEITPQTIDSISKVKWKTDDPENGHYVISESLSNDNNSQCVFMLNLGKDSANNPLDTFLVTLTKLASGKVSIAYYSLSDSNFIGEVFITPNNSTFTFVSLRGKNNVLNLAPYNWDLLFTKYVSTADMGGETAIMPVTGVLINSDDGVEVAVITDTAFADIDKSVLNSTSLHFSSSETIIGYDWKMFQLSTMTYVTDASKIFIIKSASGLYYALHFIDFYNTGGQKGYPKFEYKQI